MSELDLETLLQGLSAIPAILEMLKRATDLLPNRNKNKQAITEEILKAEKQLQLTNAKVMHSLGYELCKNHSIPVPMHSKDDKHWTCPECGNTRDTGGVGFAWL